MPSREEIAVLLQEAADSAVSCQIDFKLFHRLKEYAGQVANMRCEACKHYVPPGDDWYEGCNSPNTGHIEEQGVNFGCFSWEAKEREK